MQYIQCDVDCCQPKRTQPLRSSIMTTTSSSSSSTPSIWRNSYSYFCSLTGVNRFFLFAKATGKAIFFLRRYQKDFRFCNDDRKCLKPLGRIVLGQCQLLIRLSVIVALERGVEKRYSVMQQIRFVVTERGSTRFAFQVQGDGTIAAIFRFLFGGLDITSKYYKLADDSVCVIRSLPARVVDYLISFINSGDITFFRFLSQSI